MNACTILAALGPAKWEALESEYDRIEALALLVADERHQWSDEQRALRRIRNAAVAQDASDSGMV